MINNAYVSDENDMWRNVTEPHYRHYLSSANNTPVVICVQDFDYPDYDAIRFLSKDGWLTEHEAEMALTRYAHPTGTRPDGDAVITKYATELRSIYDNRTAGDYTFEGVLILFLLDIQGLEI